jgi:hypothetical protein
MLNTISNYKYIGLTVTAFNENIWTEKLTGTFHDSASRFKKVQKNNL